MTASNAKKQWMTFGVVCVAVLVGAALGVAALYWFLDGCVPRNLHG